MIIRLVCTPGNSSRFSLSVEGNNTQVAPFMNEKMGIESPMLNILDAYLFSELAFSPVMQPSTHRPIETIIGEHVEGFFTDADGHPKPWFLVTPTTLAYLRSMLYLGIFPSSHESDNWGQLGDYYNDQVAELNAYDESEMFRPHILQLLKVWFEKFPSLISSGKYQPSKQGTPHLMGVKRPITVLSPEDKERVRQSIGDIRITGDKAAFIPSNKPAFNETHFQPQAFLRSHVLPPPPPLPLPPPALISQAPPTPLPLPGHRWVVELQQAVADHRRIAEHSRKAKKTVANNSMKNPMEKRMWATTVVVAAKARAPPPATRTPAQLPPLIQALARSTPKAGAPRF